MSAKEKNKREKKRENIINLNNLLYENLKLFHKKS